jgi:feruloyl esterase
MNIKFPFLLILIAILSSSQIYSQEDNIDITEKYEFGENPGDLRMFVFDKIPKSDSLRPLVVALHGCNQNVDDYTEVTGWNKIAEYNRFYMLYPSQRMTNNLSRCFSWFNSKDTDTNDGEAYSIIEMINYMKKNYPIDTNRIYITGVSAGGAMSVSLLSNYPNIFTAGAIFAGCAYGIVENQIDAISVMLGTKKITDSILIHRVTDLHSNVIKYPSLIIFQGDNDVVVNPINATLLKIQWCGIHKIDTNADVVTINSLDSNVVKYEYQNDKKEPKVIEYRVSNLGHHLLINPGIEPYKGGKIGLFSKRSNFHSTFQIAKDFNLIRNE